MFANKLSLEGSKLVGSESLAFFRIVFGLLLFVSEMRFILRGWITDFYVKPQFFFRFTALNG
ncbi:HTTM domain-containing protein [Dyadobacter sp. NIV53]|uniref:HTTM domain-containing protein n=1 Tax=Dyadobacter sp. NIV53 TaxID=2861765 RepID=UPI001C886124|nr:HTTM domain-containing protein [Dyadobacter sp. NIV53]